MSLLLDAFASAFNELALRDAAGLAAARRDALDAALRDGLPHPRSESWKYTSLRTLERRGFAPSVAPESRPDAAVIAGIPAPRLVFVNGRLDHGLSDLLGLPPGAELRPLSELLTSGEPRDSQFLARQFTRPDETFARLNAALAEEGAVLRVAAGLQVATPVHLVFVGVPAAHDSAWHLRHLIELREGASLTVVEHVLAAGEHRHFANALCHVHLAARTRLCHARIQAEAAGATLIARTDAVLAREAEYRRLDLELGAGLSRHELNADLHGDGARLLANGVLLGTGKRHLDTRVGVQHVARDSSCDLVWRGLGAARSKVVFHGGILIREGADGTAASLSNKNLLLSTGAEVDTQPVLEIHADEVKAAHGATVGQLDETALFYLRSRGLPAPQARALLTAAFCRETLRVLEDAATRDRLGAHLDAALELMEAE